MAKSIEVRVEVERELVIDAGTNSRGQMRECKVCCSVTYLLFVEEAALALAGSSREILDLVDRGKIHRLKNENGLSLVCAESLLRFGRNEQLEKGEK